MVPGKAVVEGAADGHAGIRSRTMIARHTVVYVSFILPQRQFTAHREGLPNLSASSLPELRSLVAEACPEAKVVFSLSRAARAEVARRNGAPVEMGWT
jgi:hypothetical protein